MRANPNGGFYTLTGRGVNVLDRFGTPGPPREKEWRGSPYDFSAGGYRTVAIAGIDRLSGVDAMTSDERWRIAMPSRPYVAFDGTNYVVATPEMRAIRFRWIDEDGRVLRDSSLPTTVGDNAPVAVSARGDAVLFAWYSHRNTVEGALVRNGSATLLSPLVRLSSRTPYTASLAVALRDDDALVLWTEKAGDGVQLFGVRVPIAERVRIGERATRVLIATETSLSVVAATDGTRDRIGWQTPVIDRQHVRITFADLDDALRVTSSVVISDAGVDHVRPAMAASDGAIAIAWRGPRGVLRGRVLASSDPIALLAQPVSFARTWSIDVDADVVWTGDRYVVAWVRTTDPEELVVRDFDREGVPYDDLRVVARGEEIGGVKVAASSGVVLVTWMVTPEAPALLHAARIDVAARAVDTFVIPSGGEVTGTAMTAGGATNFLAVWRTRQGLMKSVIPAHGATDMLEPILVVEQGKYSRICGYQPLAAEPRYQLTFTDCRPTQYGWYTWTSYLASLTAHSGFARVLPVETVGGLAWSDGTTMVFSPRSYERRAVVSDAALHIQSAGRAVAPSFTEGGDAAFTGTRFLYATANDYTWFDRDGQPLGAPVALGEPRESGAAVAVAGDGQDGAMLIHRAATGLSTLRIVR